MKTPTDPFVCNAITFPSGESHTTADRTKGKKGELQLNPASKMSRPSSLVSVTNVTSLTLPGTAKVESMGHELFVRGDNSPEFCDAVEKALGGGKATGTPCIIGAPMKLGGRNGVWTPGEIVA